MGHTQSKGHELLAHGRGGAERWGGRLSEGDEQLRQMAVTDHLVVTMITSNLRHGAYSGVFATESPIVWVRVDV